MNGVYHLFLVRHTLSRTSCFGKCYRAICVPIECHFMLSLSHELLKVFLRNDFVLNPSSNRKLPFGTIVEPKGSGCLGFFNNFDWFYVCAKKRILGDGLLMEVFFIYFLQNSP